jgi:membrane protein YdbS with pleckstrin-like domain
MFCNNCGADIQPDAQYCPRCGIAVGDDTKPRIVIRPFFTPLNVLVSLIPLQLFFTLWGAVVFGIAGFFFIEYFELSINPWVLTLVFGILFFIFTPVIATYLLLQRYSRTEYRFYSDRLDYEEGFYAIQHKTIGLEHIIEVNMTQGFWKRLFDLGTIILSTAATGEKAGSPRSGIRIPDVQRLHETYRAVKRLIEAGKSKR